MKRLLAVASLFIGLTGFVHAGVDQVCINGGNCPPGVDQVISQSTPIFVAIQFVDGTTQTTAGGSGADNGFTLFKGTAQASIQQYRLFIATAEGLIDSGQGGGGGGSSIAIYKNNNVNTGVTISTLTIHEFNGLSAWVTGSSLTLRIPTTAQIRVSNIAIGTTLPFYPLDLYKNMVPGTIVDEGANVVGTANPQANDIFFNIFSKIVSTGGHANTANVAHLLGLHARSSDTVVGGTDLFGVQGRVDARSIVPGVEYNGVLGMVEGVILSAATSTAIMTGVRARVDVYGDQAASTLLSTGQTRGVWIEDITGGDESTRFGIFQEGTDDKNHFGGRVGIGTLTPDARLHVSSASNAGGPIVLVTTGSVRLFEVNTSSIVTAIPMFINGGIARMQNAFFLEGITAPSMTVTGAGGSVIGSDSGNVSIQTTDGTDYELVVGETSTTITEDLYVARNLIMQTTWWTGVAFPFEADASTRMISFSTHDYNARYLSDGKVSTGVGSAAYFQKTIPQNFVFGSTPVLTGITELSTGAVGLQSAWIIDFATVSLVTSVSNLTFTNPIIRVLTGLTGSSGGWRQNTTDVVIPGLTNLISSGERTLIIRARRDGQNAGSDPLESDTLIGNIGIAFRMQH